MEIPKRLNSIDRKQLLVTIVYGGQNDDKGFIAKRECYVVSIIWCLIGEVVKTLINIDAEYVNPLVLEASKCICKFHNLYSPGAFKCACSLMGLHCISIHIKTLQMIYKWL